MSRAAAYAGALLAALGRTGILTLAVAALVLSGIQPAPAAEAATLVADRVAIQGDGTLVAEGGVEVFYKGTILRARRITYDRRTGSLVIEGPIALIEGDRLILLAEAAELSADLRDGILRSARLVLDQQLQIAADEVARIGGRYTAMTRVVASSCQVCPSRPTPLWEIRAARVVHDAEERQLYFDHAQFRVAGLPIFYLPRLRMPDPSLTRATGFLLPSLRSTSSLGVGIKLPYFIALGPSRDLTLTPYLSTGSTATLDWRYRQVFRGGGRLHFEGAIGRDDLIADEWRGYVFGTGTFELPRGYVLGLRLEAVSDDAYLLDYGIDDRDLLQSGAGISRTRRDRHTGAGLYAYRSLRDGMDNAELPGIVGEFVHELRFTPALVGGTGSLRFGATGLHRSSTAPGAGRDMLRASLIADWRRNWLFDNGMVLAGQAQLAVDAYSVSQDPAYPESSLRLTPTAALELRWPFQRVESGGAVQVLEPVAQLIWSPDDTGSTPNEDSRFVAFDEGNLFDLSRFPGADRREAGLRANLGLGWNRIDPDGWNARLTFGRVIRARDLGQFSGPSGLGGLRSDWLLAGHLETEAGLKLSSRSVFGDDLSLSREELRLAAEFGRLDFATGYLWMAADTTEDRPADTSEWVLDAGWQFSDRLRGEFSGRYDFIADRAAHAALGLEFRSECVALDLSLSRRFTSSTSVKPDTDIGLSVELSGFGTGAGGGLYRRGCGR